MSGEVKKKILIFTNIFPCDTRPNAGFYIFEQVRRLKKHYDVRVIVGHPRNIFSCKKSLMQKTSFEAIEIYQPSYYTMPKIGVLASGWSYYMSTAGLIEEIHKEFKFNMVISYWTYPEGHAALKVAKKYNVPLMIRPRGSDINVFLDNKWLASRVYNVLNQTDYILPNTEHMKNRIIGMGVEKDRVSFQSNGIDAAEFYPIAKDQAREQLELSLDTKIVLFVGSFKDIKGIPYYLNAIKMLDTQEYMNLNFIFLGEGKYKSDIIKLSSELRHVSVSIPGDITHTRLNVWMSAADLLCLPSLNEGCPNVLLESLACGLPVVASDVGGIPEIINHEDLGILFEAKNSEAIAGAIKEGLTRKWDSAKLLNRIKNQSWDNVVDVLHQECERLMK